MGDIRAGWINILESSTLTPSPTDGIASGYDLYRTYDRFLDRMCRMHNTTELHRITITQPAGNIQEIDALVIPAGHNLDGITLSLDYSDTGLTGSWTTEASWTQADTAIIVKSLTARTKRYWRFTMPAQDPAPELGELYLTKLTEFTAQPLGPGARFGKRRNVTRVTSVSGVTSYVEKGDARRVVEFVIPNITSTELTTFQAWSDEWAGKKPFYFRDFEGNDFFAEFTGDVIFTSGRYHSLSAAIVEVL